ncbi:MAG: DUF368 domain-containing protein [Oscillospiraceae bacterium]|nr:DUF368 domain-containing protein [Oscillospiraceae bacterium]
MKNVKTFLYRILCGMFLGISVFAPGVSGSVMAIAMGIYRDLVRIASNPLVELKKNIRFLIPLGIGVVVSAVLFVMTFRFLFEQHEKATLLLFVGLIAGNLPVIGRELKQHSLRTRDFVGGAVAFAIAVGMGLLAVGAGQFTGTAGVTVGFLSVIVSGFVAGAITLVPGMSISAILIMLGVYGQVIVMAETLFRLQFTYLPQLIALLAAAVLGLAISAKAIKKLFDRHPGFANSCVFGFMTGTMVGIFIEALYLANEGFNWLFGGALFLLGVAIASLFMLLGKYMNRKSED